MAVIGTLKAILGVDTRTFVKGLSHASRSIAKFAKSSIGALGGLRRVVFSLKSAFVGFITGMAAKSFLDVAKNMEKLQMQLEKMTHGKGTETFHALNKWARDMPVNTQKAIDNFRLLRAYHLDPTIKDMTTIVDTVSALGGSSDILEGIARALGQISAKGRPMQQEMNQLSERGVPALAILGEKLQLTADQVAEIGRQGLKSGVVLRALIEGMEEWAGGLSRMYMRTWYGQMERLISWSTELRRVVMDSGPFTVLKANMESFLEWLDTTAGRDVVAGFANNITKAILKSFMFIGNSVKNIIQFVYKMRVIFHSMKPVLQDIGTGLKWVYDLTSGIVNSMFKWINSMGGIIGIYANIGAEISRLSAYTMDFFRPAVEDASNLYDWIDKIAKRMTEWEPFPEIMERGGWDAVAGEYWDKFIENETGALRRYFETMQKIWGERFKYAYPWVFIEGFKHIAGKMEKDAMGGKKEGAIPYIDEIPLEQILPESGIIGSYNKLHDYFSNTETMYRSLVSVAKAKVEELERTAPSDPENSKTIKFLNAFIDTSERALRALKKFPTKKEKFFPGGDEIEGALGIGGVDWKNKAEAALVTYDNMMKAFNKTTERKTEYSIEKLKEEKAAWMDARSSVIKMLQLPVGAGGLHQIGVVMPAENIIKNYLGETVQATGPTLQEIIKKAMADPQQRGMMANYVKEMWGYDEKALNNIYSTLELFVNEKKKNLEKTISSEEDIARYQEFIDLLTYGKGKLMLPPTESEAIAEVTKRTNKYLMADNATTEGLLMQRHDMIKKFFSAYDQDSGLLMTEYEAEQKKLDQARDAGMKAYQDDEFKKISFLEWYYQQSADLRDKYHTQELYEIKNQTTFFAGEWDNKHDIQGKNLAKMYDNLQNYYSKDENRTGRWAQKKLEVENMINQKLFDNAESKRATIFEMEQQLQQDLVGIGMKTRDREVAIMRDQLNKEYDFRASYLGKSVGLSKWYADKELEIEQVKFGGMIDVAEDGFDFFSDQFSRLAAEGELSFETLANSFRAMIIRMTLEWGKARFMEGFKNNVGGGLSGFLGAIGGGFTSLFGGGSAAPMTAASSVFTPTTTSSLAGLGIKGLASGGEINEKIFGIGQSGQKYMIGEAGPEIVIPKSKLKDGKKSFRVGGAKFGSPDLTQSFNETDMSKKFAALSSQMQKSSGDAIQQISTGDTNENHFSINPVFQSLDPMTGLDYMRANPTMLMQPIVEAIEAGDPSLVGALRKAKV